MVQLQTQVQELQTAVARLQQSNDERMGVLKDLVQQSADSVNKMSVAVDALQQQMRTQHDSTNTKLDQFSGQVQTLNDSLDEVKARLNNLEKAMKSVQDQQQSIDAALQNLAPNPPPHPVRTARQPLPDTSPSAAACRASAHRRQQGKLVRGDTASHAPAASSAPSLRQTRPRPPHPPSTKQPSATTWPPTTRWPPPSSARSSAPPH